VDPEVIFYYLDHSKNTRLIWLIDYGVPRGSVLCPLLFTIYITPIVIVVASFRNVHHAQYADDTQLYIALSADKALGVINDCFQSVHRWLDANGLRLNPDKTEAIAFGTKGRNHKSTTSQSPPALLFRLHEQQRVSV